MSSNQPPAITPVRHWTGQFIWCEGEAKPFHFYLYARRSFELDAQPNSARLHITASDRYALYVNGTYLGRGPARSDPRRKSYDSYEVAEHLQPGKNTIAIRAYHFGTPPRGCGGWGGWSGNAYTVGERAGLWAELDLECADGSTRSIGTDESWRLLPAHAWQRNVEPTESLIGMPEVYDATRDPVDWMDRACDDSRWDSAGRIAAGELEWFLLEARDIPMLQEREVFPTRVVKVGEVIDLARQGQTNVAQLLFSEMQGPLELATVEDPQALLENDGQRAELQSGYAVGYGIRAPYLILDFGRQLFGFPRVRLSAKQGAMFDMTYAQHLVNERIPPGLPYGDRYIARDGEQTWEVAEYRQFRYLHLGVRSLETPVTIDSVSVNEYTHPVTQRGRFECSDPILTKLWQACLDTTYLHMEDTFVCDAYRERVPWSPGACYSDHMAHVAYGGIPLIDRYLRAFPLSDRGDGMLQQDYPPEEPRHYNGAMVGMQWTRKVLNYFLHTGKRAVAAELYPSVKRQIDWFEPYRDERSLLDGLPLQLIFDDSAPTDMRGTSCIANAIYVDCLEAAAELADHFGDEADANRWRATARDVRAAVRRVFWNDTAGRYEDAHHRGSFTGIASEHTNGLVLRYGIATSEQIQRIAQHFPGDDIDLVAANILAVSPVLDGLLVAGLDQVALDIIRDRYTHILEASDHPTMWECWDPFSGKYPILSDEDYERSIRLRPKGVRSLVHAGAVFVGYVISTRILGVQPTAPGFTTCRIHPHTGDLEWAKGVMPAPQGDIEVEWQKANGKLSLRTEVPEGIEAEIVLDRTPDRQQVLSHDGSSTDLRDPAAVAVAGLLVESDAVRLRVQAGSHTFELTDLPA